MTNRFTRTLGATIGILTLLVASLATVNLLQGPRLSSAVVDPAAVVAQPGETLRLFTNERVAAVTKSQVTVTPAAVVSVSTSGQQVTVQFPQPLRYDTRYTVRVRGIRSADDGRASDISYAFHTADPSVYYLARSGTSAPDAIVETTVGSVGRRVVYSARHIDGFAVFDKALAVATASAGRSRLSFVTPGGVVQDISLPGVGTVTELHANRDTGILGFSFTSAGSAARARYSNTIFTVNANGTGIPAPVSGLGGRQVQATAWAFVPGTSELVAQQVDQSVILDDLAKKNAVTPLGQYPEFDGVSADGTSAIVSDDLGPIRIELSSGAKHRLTASRFDGSAPYTGDLAAALAPGGWIQDDQLYDDATKGFTSHLVFDDGHRARQLLTLPNPRGTIDAFSVSSNGQFVAVETTPDSQTAKPDGYSVDGRSTDETTYFVDISTGRVVKSVVGFDVRW